MIADSFYQQGVTHDTCQDYSVNGDEQYAIISDGCSNGLAGDIDSDWGARIVAKTAEELLHNLCQTGVSKALEFAREVVDLSLVRAGQFLMLPPECLYATLGVVLQCEGGSNISTLLFGDGVEGARRRADKMWEIKVYEANKGGCFYPAYLLHDDHVSNYFSKFEGTHTVKTYFGDLSQPDKMTLTVSDVTLTREQFHFASEYPTEKYDVAFVGSDGLASFFKKVNTGTSKHNEPISVPDVLSVLFDINNYRPGFMKIQRKWAFKRPLPGTFVRRDWHNSDDVSAGVVYAGDQQ